jgi:hypothetical protein
VSFDRSASTRELNVKEIANVGSDRTEFAAGDDLNRIEWATAGVAQVSNSKSDRGINRFVMTWAFNRGNYRIERKKPGSSLHVNPFSSEAAGCLGRALRSRDFADLYGYYGFQRGGGAIDGERTAPEKRSGTGACPTGRPVDWEKQLVRPERIPAATAKA